MLQPPVSSNTTTKWRTAYERLIQFHLALEAADGTLIAHSRYYWTDGNLILASDGYKFRAYGGLLAMHSPVFTNMLAMPPSPEQEIMDVDGVPVVRLSGDSSKDVEAAMAYIYDLPFIDVDIQRIGGALRFAAKYDMLQLFALAKHHLFVKYSARTFQDWKKKAWGSETHGTLTAIFALSREHSFPELAAAAFYELLTFPLKGPGTRSFDQSLECVRKEDRDLMWSARRELTNEASRILPRLPQYGVFRLKTCGSGCQTL